VAQSRDRGGDEVDFAVDRASDVPLGTQLAWKLRGEIAAGRLSAGDRLPPVRELASAAGVNVNTVRAVYARLAEQALIVSEHGRGTFVADAVTDTSALRELAARTAHEAAAHGVDPRELAAVLFADPSPRRAARAGGPAAGHPRGPHDPSPAQAAVARRTARAAIARLEGELAELDRELALLDERPPPSRPPAPARRVRAGARMLEADELETVLDSLQAQVADRRLQLAQAREHERLGARAEGDRAASPAVATKPPETVVSGGGTWTLRWRV
jgi:GntR family transcriptional regulator